MLGVSYEVTQITISGGKKAHFPKITQFTYVNIIFKACLNQIKRLFIKKKLFIYLFIKTLFIVGT